MKIDINTTGMRKITMKTLSHLLLVSRAVCALAFCLLAAGLGFYVFDEEGKKETQPRLARR
jgi:hypothetical protein